MTIRQQLDQLRLGCHDTLSAFAPYRMAHGGYWIKNKRTGWKVVDYDRFYSYHGAEISELENCSDPWQTLGTRLCTVILATVTVAAGYLLVTP